MNEIATFTQIVHTSEGNYRVNYIHIEDFINKYLKDLKIEALLQNTDASTERVATIDEIIKQLDKVNEELNKG